MDKKMLALLGFAIMIAIPNCCSQNVRCHPHCNCTVPSDVLCDSVQEIPLFLPDTVVFLTLSDNFIGPILVKYQVNRLTTLPLRELYLSNNRLEAVEDTAFSGLTQLQVLDLSNNRIAAFTGNTFVGLTKLKYLFANDAGIVNIDSQTFTHTPNIVQIDLEGNRLTNVRDQFGSLTSLRELLLAQNQIAQISPGAFSGLSDLVHLSLFDNRLLKPLDSWFRTAVLNNGIIELDFRFNSSIGRQPNNWLCCPDVALYYNFVRKLNRTLFSYPQLDVTCTWPLILSGRPISTLSMNELDMTPCLEYFATTTYLNSPDRGADTTILNKKAESENGNFLRRLNNTGAFFILLLFSVIGGALAAGFGYWYKNKQGKQKLINFKSNLLSNKETKHKSVELTKKTYPQQISSDLVKRPLEPPPRRPIQPTRPAPIVPSPHEKKTSYLHNGKRS